MSSFFSIAASDVEPPTSLCQTHPNVDKKLFSSESLIGLKNAEKSFPLNNDIGVLKWRLQTTDESFIPLTSMCDRLSTPVFFAVVYGFLLLTYYMC